MSKSRRPADDSPLYAAQKQRQAAEKLRQRQASGDSSQESPPDVVDEASDESFPASDPPAWTDTTASKDSGKH